MNNSKKSSKKTLPPPLCLPESTEDNYSHFNEHNCSTIHSCSSSNDCSHQSISYTLPISQRSQILDTLIDSSSTLLLSSSSSTDLRHKKSHYSLNSQQINFLKQRHLSRQNPPIEQNEWLEFLHLILRKPFEDELKILLDKYKTTYFDRVNSPNTTDEMIRATLCDMVSQTLATYSSNEQNSSSLPITDTIMHKKSAKRRKQSTTIDLNNQTKFVISYNIPQQNDKINSNQTFRYLPNLIEQTYLIQQGYLLKTSANKSICLMLYDEVIRHMNKSDLQINGIDIDQSFTLDQSFLDNIKSNF